MILASLCVPVSELTALSVFLYPGSLLSLFLYLVAMVTNGEWDYVTTGTMKPTKHRRRERHRQGEEGERSEAQDPSIMG